MNPLNRFASPPNAPGELIPCTQVWSCLKPHQCNQVQQVLLRVCCQLARLSQPTDGSAARTPPVPSSTEVAHE